MSNEIEKPDPKYSIKVGVWRFAPSVKLSIITLILFCVLVYLGTWQISRARYKQNIYAQLQAKIKQPPLDLKSIADPTLPKDRFMPVSVDGVFLNHYTFLIDNQILEHKPGYRVLTVLHSPQLPNWVLIDRGWVPQTSSRTILPTIDIIYGLQHITGIITNIDSGMILKKDDTQDLVAWPHLLQNLDYDLIAQQLRHPVYKFIIQLQPGSPGSYAIPPLVVGTDSDKHWGYALQWFIFAFLLLLYYVIVSTKRNKY